MPELNQLRAVQLSSKLGHAWKRLRTLELEVRNGLPTGPTARYRDAAQAGREFSDCLRYLEGIAEELKRETQVSG
jgi:hypothetical protein